MEQGAGDAVLAGGGEAGAAMRATAWARTPVGPVGSWPRSLRTMVRAVLDCRLPMYLAWGREHTQFYNDAYRPILGNKHPAIGRSVEDTWPEIWPTIGPMWAEVWAGKSVGFDHFRLTIERFGYPEDCYFNFSYSPVPDDEGKVAGVLVTFVETTEKVLNERRLRFLVELDEAVRGLTDPREITLTAARLLGVHLEVDRCAYADVEADEDTMNLSGNYLRTEGTRSIVGRMRFGDFGAEVLRLMRADEPFVVNDVGTHVPAVGDPAAYLATQVRAVVCVPLHKHDRLVAAMAVHSRTPRVWRAYEVELVRSVAARCWESIERARVERALRESEAGFRDTFELSPIGMAINDLDGRYLHVNPAYCRLVGYAREELLDPDAGLRTFAHPDDRPRVLELQRKLLAGELPAFSLEKRYVRKDGSVVWVRVSATARPGADGRPAQLIRLVEDVDERRRAEAALRESEARLRAVVEATPECVKIVSPEGLLTFMNPAGICMIEADGMASVKDACVFDLVAPEHRPGWIERHRRVCAGERLSWEFEIVGLGGTRRWMETHAVPLPLPDGRHAQLAVTREVTARKRTEAERERVLEAERAARAEAETLAEIARMVSGELDLKELVQKVTDATTKLTRAQFGAFFYNVTDAAGKSYALYALSGVPREKFSSFPMPRMTEVFGPTFRGEGVVRSDDVTKDARYGRMEPYRGMPEGHLPVRSYLAVPVVSRSGQVLGGLFFGHGEPGVFTERDERLVLGAAAQTAIAMDNAQLFESARRANEAKDSLLESERAARSEAERASRLKDEFLATLSHELRTPLNAIMGWSQLLRADAVASASAAEAVEIIERNARAQAQIIEDLLDMSRIIAGKLRLDVRRIELAAAVRAAVETVRPAAEAKGIRLQVVLDPLAGPVLGDPNRLQQVFWNLLTNAVKFTPKGGRVQVALERVNSHLEVSVTDTGEGISVGFLPHVFDRFRQADGGTTRKHGGLGLGLSIVKQLVELHGGRVRVKSGGAGQGATFTVALPLAAVDHGPGSDGDRRHPAAEDGAAPGAEVQLSGLKVLVVDDEPDARALVRRLLEDQGAEVTLASSASEAFERLRAGPPDVLVSDIGMPEEDGYALIRRVRGLSAEQGGGTPALALTAYARPTDRMAALRAGFQQYVVKPVEPAELVTVVAALAGRLG